MPTLGEKLKEARERKGVTASEAAAVTRIKVQHIESMERDDFSNIAAPAYAKGFIKLYGDYLGLDPVPLVEEYAARHAPQDSATVLTEPSKAKGSGMEEGEQRPLRFRWRAMLAPVFGPRVWIVVGGVVFVLFVLPPIIHFAKRIGQPGADKPAEETYPTALSILREPPEPYFELSPEPAP